MAQQLPRSLKEAFNRKRSLLRRKIVIDGGLLDTLLDMNLITHEDLSSIMNIPTTPYERKRELIKLLEKSNVEVRKFFTALHNSGQDEVLVEVFRCKWQDSGDFVFVETEAKTAGNISCEDTLTPLTPDQIGSALAYRDFAVQQVDAADLDGALCFLAARVNIQSIIENYLREEIEVRQIEIPNEDEWHQMLNYEHTFYHKYAMVKQGCEVGRYMYIVVPYHLLAVIDKVSMDIGQQVKTSYMNTLKSLNISLRNQNPDISPAVIIDNEQLLIQWFNGEMSASDFANEDSTSTSTTLNDELDGGSQSEPVSSVSLQNIGQSLAWIYIHTIVSTFVEGLCTLYQVEDLFPSLIHKLIIMSEEVVDEAVCVGLIGMLGIKHNFVTKYRVLKLRSDKQGHCILVDYAEPFQVLDVLYRSGKLSERECKQEKENCLSFMVENLANNAELQQSCLVLSPNEHVDIDKLTSCVSSKLACSDNGKNYKDSKHVPKLDLETDGLPYTGPVKSQHEKQSPGTTITAVSFEPVTESGCDDTEPPLRIPCSLDCEESQPEKFVKPTSTQMALAGFKQCGLINDVACSKLARLPTSCGRRLVQAEVVFSLLLFCMVSFRQHYTKFIETLTALQNRASDSLRLVPEDKNNAAELEPKEVHSSESDNFQKGDSSQAGPTSLTADKQVRILTVILDILFSIVEDKKYLPYDFELQLRTAVFKHKIDVSTLRNKDGYSLLHFIVINNRPQFVLPIFRTGCWNAMKPLTVERGKRNEHEGRTADDIAAILHLRKVQKELDTYTVWEKSLNLLHVEARNGDLERVRHWLLYSSDLHTELDSMQCTTLYWACIGGNLDIVNLLLKMKVDYRQVNSRKENLLHAACMLGHHHLIETLVKECNMDFTVKDAAKKSPLLRVSENGDEKSLAKLLECGLKVDMMGTILAIAGHYGRLNFIRLLVDKYGIHPQSKDEAGKPALLRAAEQGRIEVLKYLFTKNIDFEEADVRKRNILHVIADGASKEVMEFVMTELKSRNVDLKSLMNARDKYIGGELCMLIRGKDKGRDSWHYVEVSRALMDIFMKKTRGGTIDVAKYGNLLHSGWGADPDEAAAREIERRFETRRNANSVEDADSTPLHIAAFKDKLDVAEVLLDNGADPNIRDKFGMTALHVAAMRGNMKLVQRLVDGGATADALDTMVKTPAEVAEDNEHKDVSNYLKGVKYLPIAAHFRERVLPNVARLVGPDSIRAVHESGQDLRTHLINLMRDLTVDINETLLSLGSGPVLEESSSRQHLS